MSPEGEGDATELASKTRRKKEAQEQQRLGQHLTALNSSELQRLDLPEKLLQAIAEYKRLPNSFGARRRQLQFIGKLMRDVDCKSIELSISRMENGASQNSEQSSLLESIADSILNGGSAAIEQTLSSNPQLQRQALRQFLLEYQRASEEIRPRVKSRLIKHLAGMLGGE